MVYQAHHLHLQKCFDKREIRFGVQWQIARLVTLGHITYEDVLVPALDALKGPNQSTAPLVDKLFCRSVNEANDSGTSGFFSKEKEATVR